MVERKNKNQIMEHRLQFNITDNNVTYGIKLVGYITYSILIYDYKY